MTDNPVMLGSFNVLPLTASDDAHRGCARDTVSCSNFTMRHASLFQESYVADILLRELCRTLFLSTSMPALSDTIREIVSDRPEKEVVRVEAGRVVTGMADMQTACRVESEKQDSRDAMRALYSGQTNPAISERMCWAYPIPAPCISVDFTMLHEAGGRIGRTLQTLRSVRARCRTEVRRVGFVLCPAPLPISTAVIARGRDCRHLRSCVALARTVFRSCLGWAVNRSAVRAKGISHAGILTGHRDSSSRCRAGGYTTAARLPYSTSQIIPPSPLDRRFPHGT